MGTGACCKGSLPLANGTNRKYSLWQGYKPAMSFTVGIFCAISAVTVQQNPPEIDAAQVPWLTQPDAQEIHPDTRHGGFHESQSTKVKPYL
jgi:hypothetical protein